MRVVESVPAEEAHRLNDCVAAVVDSPTACRRVLDALTALGASGELTTEPRWDSTMRALVRLVDALNAPRRRY